MIGQVSFVPRYAGTPYQPKAAAEAAADRLAEAGWTFRTQDDRMRSRPLSGREAVAMLAADQVPVMTFVSPEKVAHYPRELRHVTALDYYCCSHDPGALE